ncbi:helix-turn-helix domain-containing protein [Rhizobiaceae bacterium n13]|uniref:helix-turn-helix transcriptional regulator n=1 Tax=Ferirhizobium litorale TaxID=2927786 RepID=UPI0024B30F4C|nr:helix-turn-helix domain-containing protein [Fererhizobium litorale]MDI7862527.1 helix-turn-helix domain-containing protein [Fererhizobium litorale]
MASHEILPSEHPGEIIAEELEARDWSQADLAFVLGWDVSQLNRLIKGKTDVTPESANMLGDAFNMPAEFFMNLQQMYDLGRAKKADPGVRTRASWTAVFPVREMIKRGWIDDTESSLLDVQMVRFFGRDRREEVPFVSDAPVLAHAARKSSYSEILPSQYAWLHRVRSVAQTIACSEYSEDALRNVLPTLRAHFIDPDDLPRIPALLKRCGVRVVLVEQIAGSKIDGVCTWLDDQPVIGLTNRLDRIDNLCFVLRHEIEHVLRGDGREETFAPIDDFDGNLGSGNPDLPESEKLANAAAADFCVDQAMLQSFILRKSPYISEKDVRAFAARAQIHPAVIVGQIQHKTQRHGWLRKYQTSIRAFLKEWEAVDGWDNIARVDL